MDVALTHLLLVLSPVVGALPLGEPPFGVDERAGVLGKLALATLALLALLLDLLSVVVGGVVCACEKRQTRFARPTNIAGATESSPWRYEIRPTTITEQTPTASRKHP